MAMLPLSQADSELLERCGAEAVNVDAQNDNSASQACAEVFNCAGLEVFFLNRLCE